MPDDLEDDGWALVSESDLQDDTPSQKVDNTAFTENELKQVIKRCASSSVFASGSYLQKASKTDFHGTDQHPISPLFENEEHRYIGDAVVLPGHNTADPKDPSAARNPFTFPNKLVLTYGQITALAGDFFGIAKPICRGADPKEMKQRFRAAYNTLAQGDAGRCRALELLNALKLEHDMIQKAIAEGKSAHEAYQDLPDQTFEFEKITQAIGAGVSYLELAEMNLDHFGCDARTAYDAGHTVALDMARNGDLETAYMMNAFADHYLQDSFSSGHMRTPREALSEGYLTNICANFMHNEDNMNGLHVWTPNNQVEWRAFGDTMLFEEENHKNLNQLFLALNASVQEVFEAYQKFKAEGSKSRPDRKRFPTYIAWKHAPAPESLSSKESNGAPMFVVIDGVISRRSDLANREDWTYVPVVGLPLWWKKSWPNIPEPLLYYLCWGWTAWNLAPPGQAKRVIVSWLRAHGLPIAMLRRAHLKQ